MTVEDIRKQVLRAAGGDPYKAMEIAVGMAVEATQALAVAEQAASLGYRRLRQPDPP